MPHGTQGSTDPHRGPTQGTHIEGTHTRDPHRGPTQGTHTGDPHRGEGPSEDPPPEGRATQGTHTEDTQTSDSPPATDYAQHYVAGAMRPLAASIYICVCIHISG